MKLRMTGSPEVGKAFCGSMDALEHDAMCAHALMKALEQFSNTPLASNIMIPQDIISCITDRASEFMQEWLGEAP